MNWHGTVTDETGRRYPDVGIRSSGATVNVRTRGGTVLMDRADLTAETSESDSLRILTFGNGDVWRVERKRGGG